MRCKIARVRVIVCDRNVTHLVDVTLIVTDPGAYKADVQISVRDIPMYTLKYLRRNASQFTKDLKALYYKAFLRIAKDFVCITNKNSSQYIENPSQDLFVACERFSLYCEEFSL